MTGGGARHAGTAGRHTRWSASLVVAVAMHAAVLALVAGSAIVRLDVVPVRIDLAFLEASDRTAGPGEPAPELRVAAPAPPDASLPPPAVPPEPAHREPPPEPAPQEPVVKLAPERVVKPPSPPVAKPQSRTAARKPDAPAGAPSASSADAGASHSSSGTDTRSTAPAWAATARVRYEQLLFAWMDRHKQYPLLAQRRGLEGTGSVRVRIGRDGRVLDRALVQSTGQSMLDQAALEMVRRASPFPAVPAEYAGDSFEFVAPIQYRLH